MASILPAPQVLELLSLRSTGSQIYAAVRPRSLTGNCPLCGISSHVHSRYHRTLLDVPWCSVTLRLDLSVRRFFCDQPGCVRTIFTERLPEVVAPYARRTRRLADWFTLIGLILGGEAGARLLKQLGATSWA
jgi:transposase